MPLPGFPEFFSWFQSHGGYIDTSSFDIVTLPSSEGGRGAIALKDIPEGHTIFSVPGSILLSERTSGLPHKFGLDAWKSAKLDVGWSGTILCLMWEAALGSGSKWEKYFDILPDKFDNPMFWDAGDLSYLRGTAVVDKIGKEQAEVDFKDKIMPAILSRPDLFKPEDIFTRYSLEKYHIMGTLLHTRSFTIEVTEESEMQAVMEDVGNTNRSGVDVDGEHEQDSGNSGEQLDDDEENGVIVALTPLADMLNGRYEQNNVKLFCEPDCLKMISVKPIKAGEQIWNTYNDRPNSDLLRCFGYVDYLPLPAHLYGENRLGNPGDIVEIRADLVVKEALQAQGAVEVLVHERIDWWLEEGGDDIFILEIDPSTKSLSSIEVPPSLLSFTRLILFDSEWERSKIKGKPPRPKLDFITLSVIKRVLAKREEDYSTTLEMDEVQLSDSSNSLTHNYRNALIVSTGEKRLLKIYLRRVDELLAETVKGKRRTEDNSGERRKKKKH